MKKFLPSKKFLYILFSVILAILIIIGAQNLLDRQKSNSAKKQSVKKITYEQFMDLDSDGDGLKDWEEALWKTDPQKNDSDSDGTTDGQEVVANRDPLKSAPNDEIDPKIIAEQKKTEAEFKELTQTEQLSRVLFSQYIAAKGSRSLKETDKQIILDTAINSIEGTEKQFYTISDFKIISDHSTSTIKNYGNTLGQAFFTGTAQEKVENELVIIDRAVKNVDESALKNLDPIIESYGKTIVKLSSITVPTEAISVHLLLINDLANLKMGLENIQKLFTDPAKAISGMKTYQSASANLVKDMTDIKSFFFDRGITYTNKEPGYYILNVI